jgi:hypothetical protein
LDDDERSEIKLVGDHVDPSDLFTHGLTLSSVPPGEFAIVTLEVAYSSRVLSRPCNENLVCPFTGLEVAHLASSSGGLNLLDGPSLPAGGPMKLTTWVEFRPPNPDAAAAVDFLPQLNAAQGGLKIGEDNRPYIVLPIVLHSLFYNTSFTTNEDCNFTKPQFTAADDPIVTCSTRYTVVIDMFKDCLYETGDYQIDGSIQIEGMRDYTILGRSIPRLESTQLAFSMNLAGELSNELSYCLSSHDCSGYPCIGTLCQCPQEFWRPDCTVDSIPPQIRCPADQLLADAGTTLYVTLQQALEQAPAGLDNQPLSLPLLVQRQMGDREPQNVSSPDLQLLEEPFRDGLTRVSYLVRDAAGNTASCEFNVYVIQAAFRLQLTNHRSETALWLMGNLSKGVRLGIPPSHKTYSYGSEVSALAKVESEGAIVTNSKLKFLNLYYSLSTDGAHLIKTLSMIAPMGPGLKS